MPKENYTVKLKKETYELLEKEAVKNFRTPELQLEFMLNNIIKGNVSFESIPEVKVEEPTFPPTREEFERTIGQY